MTTNGPLPDDALLEAVARVWEQVDPPPVDLADGVLATVDPMKLSATVGRENVSVLANPRIRIKSREKALIKVGERVGNNWVITEGLQAGEKVVAEGFQKVRDGMTVNVAPFVQTAAVEGR